MKHPMSALRGLLLVARDGPVGRLSDLYFHEPLWIVRALAVNGHLGRRIFVPAAAVQPASPWRELPVELTLGEIAKLSRLGDLSARSAQRLRGYGMEASDGNAGRLDDLLVDDASWSIVGLILEPGGLYRGKRHMVAPATAKAIDSIHRRVLLRLTRQQILSMPPFETARAYG